MIWICLVFVQDSLNVEQQLILLFLLELSHPPLRLALWLSLPIITVSSPFSPFLSSYRHTHKLSLVHLVSCWNCALFGFIWFCFVLFFSLTHSLTYCYSFTHSLSLSDGALTLAVLGGDNGPFEDSIIWPSGGSKVYYTDVYNTPSQYKRFFVQKNTGDSDLCTFLKTHSTLSHFFNLCFLSISTFAGSVCIFFVLKWCFCFRCFISWHVVCSNNTSWCTTLKLRLPWCDCNTNSQVLPSFNAVSRKLHNRCWYVLCSSQATLHNHCRFSISLTKVLFLSSLPGSSLNFSC